MPAGHDALELFHDHLGRIAAEYESLLARSERLQAELAAHTQSTSQEDVQQAPPRIASRLRAMSPRLAAMSPRIASLSPWSVAVRGRVPASSPRPPRGMPFWRGANAARAPGHAFTDRGPQSQQSWLSERGPPPPSVAVQPPFAAVAVRRCQEQMPSSPSPTLFSFEGDGDLVPTDPEESLAPTARHAAPAVPIDVPPPDLEDVLMTLGPAEMAATSLAAAEPLVVAESGESGARSENVSHGPMRHTTKSTQSSADYGLRLHAVWREPIDCRTPVSVVMHVSSQSDGISGKRAGEDVKDDSCLQCFVCRPSSSQRIAWDLASVVIMLYDLVMIPLQVFNLPDTRFSVIMGWTSTLFWTLDMLGSFFIGFHERGAIEMRPARIARHYLKTWFGVDITVLAIDWIQIAISGSETTESIGILRISKSLRLGRVLRMLRLLRLVKVLSVVTEFSDYIQSDSILTILGVCRLTMGIFAINHFIACAWYGLGTIELGPRVETWVEKLERDYNREVPTEYRYATSLHWSLTQFTPASMEVTPRNALERAFTVCIITMALVLFSSFVSSITAAMTRLHQINSEQTRLHEKVRRYITDNKVSLELGNCVYGFIRQHKSSQSRRVLERDVAVFEAMPEELRIRLHYEVYVPVLLAHPFFHLFVQVDNFAVSAVSHLAMSQELLPSGQQLFAAGKRATRMYVVLGGAAQYQFERGSEQKELKVEVRDFVSEIAIWAVWDHRGLFVAEGNCEFAALDHEAFRQILTKHAPFRQCRDFAQAYLARLDGEELTDIWREFDVSLELAQTTFDLADDTDAKVGRGWSRKWKIAEQANASAASLPSSLAGRWRVFRFR